MGEGEALKHSAVIKSYLMTAAERLHESDFVRMLKQFGPGSGSDGND